ncbi:MAG: hypothetical protein OXG35_33865 [Acidobacteria bacterium]|nr:hypothetical protein [Acidobacteriota bacterium]
MQKLPAEGGAVTGTVLARRLLENTRNLQDLAREEQRSSIEIGPEGLRLHTTDRSDWHHPANITIGPIPMLDAPAERVTISTEPNELALWAEHLTNANPDDAVRLTIDPALDRRPGQNLNGRHEHLTCRSMRHETSVSIPGYRSTGTDRTGADRERDDTEADPRTCITMRTKCLLKLLSRLEEIIPDSTESGDHPVRLRLQRTDDGRRLLETALAGPYAYVIQTKPVRHGAGQDAETYIPWKTAHAWIRLTHGRPALLGGTTTVTDDAITTAPPKTPGESEDAAPIHIQWRYADRCSKRFPNLDVLRASHADTDSVTLDLRTHETARTLDFVCRALENRGKGGTNSYKAAHEFVRWDFQADEVRALNDRLRIPLSKLCETHNRDEYKHLGAMELHSSRLRRVVDFWLRHGPASTISHLPVEFFMTTQRIRVRRTWGHGRATETTVQGSEHRS